MNRVKSVSWWCAAVMGGLLLALPAAAAPKQKDPEQCRYECQRKAMSAVDMCSQACPRGQDPEATGKCMTACGEKYRAAEDSCNSTCPAVKPLPPQEPPPQEPPKKK